MNRDVLVRGVPGGLLAQIDALAGAAGVSRQAYLLGILRAIGGHPHALPPEKVPPRRYTHPPAEPQPYTPAQPLTAPAPAEEEEPPRADPA